MELPLPKDSFPDFELFHTKIVKNYIEKYITSTVPKGDLKNLEKDFNYTFVLDRFSQVNTTKRRKLPKTGWNYESLSRIHEMWKEYLRQNLDFVKKAPTYQDPDWLNFSTVIAKSELIGAEITIVRSKVPSQIGLKGILVLETKMTFQLVTPANQLKTILKETSVFEFCLDNMKFTIFGKHLMTRASERSVKKIKGHMIPDL